GGDPQHFPQVPEPVRVDHWHAVRAPRLARRARGQGGHGMGHWAVCRQDREQRSAARGFPRLVRRGAGRGAAGAADGYGQAVHPAADQGPGARAAGAQVGDGGDGQPGPARSGLHVLAAA
ncbi:hypothetical protein BN1723_020201, partial [Verticillium longisporum]